MDKNYIYKSELKNCEDLLEKILEENKVSECHGIVHAKKVLENAKLALEYYKISEEDHIAVLLAALLHDADDRKFFPKNNNCENAKIIMEKSNLSDQIIKEVLFMISLIPSSKNGDTIPDSVKDKEWKLIPRYADRLEALGLEGIRRCILYNKVIKLPFFVETTPKPKTEEELWEYATVERYNAYNGNSISLLDHYYDKLLRLSDFPIKNSYFEQEVKLKRKPLIDFVLHFSKLSSFSYEDMEIFLEEYKK